MSTWQQVEVLAMVWQMIFVLSSVCALENEIGKAGTEFSSLCLFHRYKFYKLSMVLAVLYYKRSYWGYKPFATRRCLFKSFFWMVAFYQWRAVPRMWGGVGGREVREHLHLLREQYTAAQENRGVCEFWERYFLSVKDCYINAALAKLLDFSYIAVLWNT